MEYGADKFISWGQKKLPNFDINFDPLPSPQLRMSYKKNNSEKILFVSTPHVYNYPRYVSSQCFDDIVKKINDTVLFLDRLGDNYIKNVNYKDYLYQFSEKNYLKEKFKSLNFINVIPEKKLNNSNLIVLNNYSTFLFKSLAANAPTVFICQRNCWKVNDEALELYDNLYHAGILFYEPILAAEKIKTVWTNVTEWWSSSEVQIARKEFCDEFALRDDKWRSIWTKYLWHV